MTNEELAEAIKTGQKDFIETLWNQCYRYIKYHAGRWARAFNRIDVDAEDLEQCGYFAVCSAVEGWDACRGHSFISYLDFCLKTEFAKAVGCRTTAKSKEPIYNSISFETPASSDSDGLTIEDTLGVDCAALEAVDENIYQDQLSVLVREAVAQLPEKQRTAIEMNYLQGLPLADVARKLCISGSRAGQLCKEGLRMIRNGSNAPSLQALLYYDLNFYNGTGLKAWKRTGCSVQEQILIRNEDKVRRHNYDNSREAKIAYCVRELDMTREAAERLFPV